MYIVQYLNGSATALWHFPDVIGQMLDQQDTERRKKEWDNMIAQCRKEAFERHPSTYEGSEFYPHVRSRLNCRDIPDADYREFTKEVANRMVGKVVGKNKPRLVHNKLK